MATKAAKSAPTIEPVTLPSSFKLKFSAAEKFFAGKVPYTRLEFDQLAAHAQVHAFTVARIASVELIEDIRKEVQRAIIDGTTLANFRASFPDLMAKHGWSGTTPWHIETIFRTNVQTAYGMGQLDSLRENADIFPFWKYVAINDARVRPSHLALDGRIYRANHAFWKTHFPPWGYNCRCDVISLTEEQVGRQRVYTDDGPPAEDNFNGPGQAEFAPTDPQKIANKLMPRSIGPAARSALKQKLDITEPVPLYPDEGKRPIAEAPPLVGPTDAEIDEAIKENKKFDRKQKIKGYQAKHALKKKAEKAAAKAAAEAAAKAPTPEEIDVLHEEALAEDVAWKKKRAAELAAKKAASAEVIKKLAPTLAEAGSMDVEALVNLHLKDPASVEDTLKKLEEIAVAEKLKAAAKAAKLAAVKANYPAITKDLPDDVIEKYYLNMSDAELAAKEAVHIAYVKAEKLKHVLSPSLTKEEIAALTPEEKKIRRADQIARSRETAKAKAAAERAARRAGGVTEPQKTVPAAADTADPLQRLSTLDYQGSGTHGVPLRRDAGALEGHALNVRMVQTADGRHFYEIYGKAATDDLANYVRGHRDWTNGGTRLLPPSPQDSHIFREGKGKLTPYHSEGQAESIGNGDRRWTLGTPDGQIEFRVDQSRWYDDISAHRGTAVTARTFQIRVPRTGNDATDFARIESTVKGTPLEPILKPTTAAESRRVGIIRAITHDRPGLMMPGGVSMKFRGATAPVRSSHLWKLSEAELRTFAKENGITLKLDTVAVRDMPKTGYTTHTVERNFDYEKLRIFHGTKGDGKYVANMIEKGSVQASYHRARAGYGGLTEADDRTGGSDSLFTRLFNRDVIGKKPEYEGQYRVKFADHGFSGNYQFVWKAKELERLDIYAFNADTYGRAYGESIKKRKTIEEMARLKDHNTANELMVRYGIDFTNLDFINANNETLRQSLLTELRRKGITKINGRAIEQVVKVKPYLYEAFEP